MPKFKVEDYKEVQTQYGLQLKAERIVIDADGFVIHETDWIRVSDHPAFYERWQNWDKEGA